MENEKLINLSEHIAERLHNIRLVKICHTEALEKYKLKIAINDFYEYVKHTNNLGEKSSQS